MVHRAPVGYPDAAQIKNIKGTVSVEVHLDQSGNVSDARVLSGPEELRKPVLQSVLGWHFTPDSAGSTRVVNVEFQAPSEEKAKTAAPPPPPPPPPPDSNTRQDVERTTEFLRAELAQIKANLAQAQAQADANQDGVQAREAQMQARARLAELQVKLAEAEAATRLERVGPIPEALQGRMLRSIRVVALGTSPEDFLAQAQLPIREGDVLTRESAEAAAAAVKKFDEHLSLFWSVRPDGGVEMTIAAPGASIGGRGGCVATKGSGVSFP